MSRPAGCRRRVLVGLPEPAVKESTHRVERAMVNSGFQRPQNRVVINLAPADLPKEAASFDLPIALGILAGSGQIRRASGSSNTPSSANWPSTARTRPAKGASRWRWPPTVGTPNGNSDGGQCPRYASWLIVPSARGRGGRGRRRRDHPRRQPRPGRRVSHRRDRDRAAALAARRAVPHLLALRRRFRRRPRPGDGQAGGHGRGRRRPQHPDARPARLGQDDAGQADAHDPARPDARANRSRPRASTARSAG